MKNFDMNMIKERVFLTDGGLETTLIFHHDIDLPHFAAFDLLNKPQYQPVLEDYYKSYLDLAIQYQTGFIFETPTWRANPDWAYKMGYSMDDLDKVNQKAVRDLQKMRERHSGSGIPMAVSGCIGPRGDGYTTDQAMSTEEAELYHSAQVASFVTAGVDLITGITINYKAEALGIIRAAKAEQIPVVISFTVETDGLLPSGENLEEVIRELDLETGGYASYYMINCAHPSHFQHILKGNWMNRLMGIRANASCKSHAELDESEVLDIGNIHELAEDYLKLRMLIPELKVIGGCCGTDHSHMETICKTWQHHELISSSL